MTDDTRHVGSSLVFRAALLLIYLGSTAALWSTGLVPVVPFTFLLYLMLVALPTAFGLSLLPRVLSAVNLPRVLANPIVAVMCGLAVLVLYRPDHPAAIAPLFMLLVGFAAWLAIEGRHLVKTLVSALAALALGYGSVWNLNYLVLWTSVDRLNDPFLRELDLLVYRWLFRSPDMNYTAIFPLVGMGGTFRLLETAYVFLFVELILVTFLLVRHGLGFHRFLVTIFGCYSTGLAVFLVYPAVGPCIYFPESFDSIYADTRTYALMQAMASEYQAVASLGASNGYGYFVALPSLHVALAILLQAFVRPWRFLFWMCVPVNLLLIASTVLLGYHYVVDAVAGVGLAASALLALRWFESGWFQATRRAGAVSIVRWTESTRTETLCVAPTGQSARRGDVVE